MAQHGIIEFDLSAIPANATIVSAYLTLYNNPNSANGLLKWSTLSIVRLKRKLPEAGYSTLE